MRLRMIRIRMIYEGGGFVNDIQVCMYELKVFPEDSKHLIVGWLVGLL